MNGKSIVYVNNANFIIIYSQGLEYVFFKEHFQLKQG